MVGGVVSTVELGLGPEVLFEGEGWYASQVFPEAVCTGIPPTDHMLTNPCKCQECLGTAGLQRETGSQRPRVSGIPRVRCLVMLGETLSFPTPEPAYERLRLAQS